MSAASSPRRWAERCRLDSGQLHLCRNQRRVGGQPGHDHRGERRLCRPARRDRRQPGRDLAQLGTVALAGGRAITLDVAGDGLLNVAVDTGAMRALVSNGGMIQADGGQVVLTTQAAGQLLRPRSTTPASSRRTIGRTRRHDPAARRYAERRASNLPGNARRQRLDGGDGGFIETSAAQVNIAKSAPGPDRGARRRNRHLADRPAGLRHRGRRQHLPARSLALLMGNNVTISTMLPGRTPARAALPPTAISAHGAKCLGDIDVTNRSRGPPSSGADDLAPQRSPRRQHQCRDHRHQRISSPAAATT